MRKIIITTVLFAAALIFGGITAYADSFMPPEAFEIWSEDGTVVFRCCTGSEENWAFGGTAQAGVYRNGGFIYSVRNLPAMGAHAGEFLFSSGPFIPSAENSFGSSAGADALPLWARPLTDRCTLSSWVRMRIQLNLRPPNRLDIAIVPGGITPREAIEIASHHRIWDVTASYEILALLESVEHEPVTAEEGWRIVFSSEESATLRRVEFSVSDGWYSLHESGLLTVVKVGGQRAYFYVSDVGVIMEIFDIAEQINVFAS